MTKFTYLGVAGWLLQSGASSLLIDPYFTRLSMRQVLLGWAVPDTQVIARYAPPAQWILASHAHYDHLMDAPEVARLTGAQVLASLQGVRLMQILGVNEAQRACIHPGDVIQCGDFRVEVYKSRHRTLFGTIPYMGPLPKGLAPPLRARNYRIDEQFSFRITARDMRVLVASGIDEEPAVAADVLLVGADATRSLLRPILNATHPRLVLPNHWDDMFRSLNQPLRPMYVPPRGLIPSLRRINLDAFSRAICDLSPHSITLIPQLFSETDIDALINAM